MHNHIETPVKCFHTLWWQNIDHNVGIKARIITATVSTCICCVAETNRIRTIKHVEKLVLDINKINHIP